MIHIDGDIYIDADDRCYSLVQRRVMGEGTKEPGKEYFTPLGSYHTTLSHCLSAFVRLKQRKVIVEGGVNLKEMINAFKKIEDDTRKLFTDLVKEGI